MVGRRTAPQLQVADFCSQVLGPECRALLDCHLLASCTRSCQSECYMHTSIGQGCWLSIFLCLQLHAAVVELSAGANAEIKYSTVQNWYAGNEDGLGGIFNFVTKRGLCAGANSHISWTQVRQCEGSLHEKAHSGMSCSLPVAVRTDQLAAICHQARPVRLRRLPHLLDPGAGCRCACFTACCRRQCCGASLTLRACHKILPCLSGCQVRAGWQGHTRDTERGLAECLLKAQPQCQCNFASHRSVLVQWSLGRRSRESTPAWC